ncbi:pleckstrin homology domain-containing family A member 4 isoform X3 [Oncorhynchus masou masou]|uniref:pleckstrin homology domain-containing family A member 4 isoform X3 n=1 Tax=Oncorhynchus masou masou TaxID=90313 RepID=UPI0031837D0B
MEVETASRQTRLVRMEDQDRMSHASSVVTISSFPVRSKDGDDRVQTFGKRCRAAKRDPNCPVVIRGWLNKKDSSGLKLWKRRWFVLSNYCLFYYKDSREESVLGSIPLPSYNILFCTPRECKNRKNTFKVVHQGMRSYFFSADTQEDMLGWVRALSQSACMEADGSINRRCSSYQDFTQIGGSSESVDLPHSPSLSGPRNAAHTNTSQRNPSQVARGRMGAPHSEPRGRRSVRRSPSPRTPSPTEFSSRRRDRTDEDSLPFHSGPNTPPKPTEFMGTGSLTPRGQLGSRPHTPVGRVDIRPQEDPPMSPQTLCYTPASPKMEFKSAPHTPGTDRWHTINRPTPVYSSLHHTPSGRRAFGKSSKSEMFKEKETPPPVRPLESETDAVLTRLCGCDKLLQSLSLELAHLQVDKDSVQCALEMTRLQLDEWRNQGLRGQEGALTQKALLQEELVTIRARMCDVSLEMDRVWSQYERMESELSVFRSHLQHVCNFGMPQEQSQAQRELWMMDDILSGLRVNRDNFRVLLGFQRHTVPTAVFQKSSSHPGTPGSPTERMPGELPTGVESEPPARPPLPQELQDTNQGRDQGHVWMNPNYEGIYGGPGDPLDRRGNSQSDLHGDRTQRETSESQSSSRWSTPDITNKKGRMSEEEQIERMRRHQERVASRRKPPMSGPTSQTQYQSSEPKEEVEGHATLLTSAPDPDLTPEQREAKLRRVERIRERVIRSAVRESAVVPGHPLTRMERQELHNTPSTQKTYDKARKSREMPVSGPCEDVCGGWCHGDGRALRSNRTVEPPTPGEKTLYEDEGKGHIKGHEGHIGNKTLHKGHGDRKGIMKCKKEKAPSTSSNKISSMTVYQTDGGLQFKRCEDKEQEEDQKELLSYHVESSSLSTNLKAEWFLSTNQWREFIPLRDHGIETLCQKETLNVDNDPTAHDVGTDSNGDMFSVSESLEKMLENHSLFYKITSDINLSDTDITMTDGQSVSNQGEEIEGATNDISTADEVTYRVVRPTDQQIEGCHHSESSTSHGIATDDSGDITTTNEPQDLTSKDRNAPLSANQTLCVSSKPGHDLCIYEEISDNDALPKATEEPSQESQGKIMQSQEWRRPNPESWNHPESEQVPFMHMCGRAETGQENCGTVDMKVEQEGTGELKVANSSVSGERNHAVQNRRSPSKTNSLGLYEEERADRSASFGRGRVTVLRTSL